MWIKLLYLDQCVPASSFETARCVIKHLGKNQCQNIVQNCQNIMWQIWVERPPHCDISTHYIHALSFLEPSRTIVPEDKFLYERVHVEIILNFLKKKYSILEWNIDSQKYLDISKIIFVKCWKNLIHFSLLTLINNIKTRHFSPPLFTWSFLLSKCLKTTEKNVIFINTYIMVVCTC